MLPVGGFLLAIYLGWILDKDLIHKEFAQGSKARKIFSSWFFLVRYLVPIGIFLIFLQQGGFIDLDKIFKN